MDARNAWLVPAGWISTRNPHGRTADHIRLNGAKGGTYMINITVRGMRYAEKAQEF